MFWVFFAIYFLIVLVAVYKHLQRAFETDEQLQARLLSYSDPSDQSYLAQMTSDVSPEVALGVRRIIVDVGGVEVDEVWPQTPLTDLLE